MPKKRSSKTSVEAEEASVLEPTKSSSTPKKSGSEIDDIFAGKKRKKSEKQENENESEKPKSLKKKKKKKTKEEKEGRFTEPASRPRKRTEDGFNIYTEEELGINSSNAGGTPLCPFDCDCCF